MISSNSSSSGGHLSIIVIYYDVDEKVQNTYHREMREPKRPAVKNSVVDYKKFGFDRKGPYKNYVTLTLVIFDPPPPYVTKRNVST